MAVRVVEYSPDWPASYRRAARVLADAVGDLDGARIEHVGSTSVPGLAAKPIIDIDVIVPAAQVQAAVDALVRIGYRHRGDLGVPQREAFHAPDDDPRRNVYVCVEGSLNLRNHLAVREVLRRDSVLRDRYSAAKLALAADPDMDVETYTARKTPVLRDILERAGIAVDDRETIARLNEGSPRP